jgi:D-glycero-D-manno-heptose 1,7-bisphosphate phosphatase
MNRYLMKRLPLRDVLTCYHDNADNCLCRKPKPGMIHGAAGRHGILLESSFMIGDRWSDIIAGAAAGCRTFLIGAPYSQAEKCRPDCTVSNLLEASAIILGRNNPIVGSALAGAYAERHVTVPRPPRRTLQKRIPTSKERP